MSYAAFRWTFRLTSRSPGNSSLGIGAFAVLRGGIEQRWDRTTRV